jgi:hypothetical protein
MIQSVGGQPPGGPGGPPPSKPMTEEAKKQVTDILSQYDSENLSSEDMDAINKSFKDAGIRPSGELKSMLEDSGFDAKALGDRARQTQGADGGGPPPGGPLLAVPLRVVALFLAAVSRRLPISSNS